MSGGTATGVMLPEAPNFSRYLEERVKDVSIDGPERDSEPDCERWRIFSYEFSYGNRPIGEYILFDKKPGETDRRRQYFGRIPGCERVSNVFIFFDKFNAHGEETGWQRQDTNTDIPFP